MFLQGDHKTRDNAAFQKRFHRNKKISFLLSFPFYRNDNFMKTTNMTFFITLYIYIIISFVLISYLHIWGFEVYTWHKYIYVAIGSILICYVLILFIFFNNTGGIGFKLNNFHINLHTCKFLIPHLFVLSISYFFL